MSIQMSKVKNVISKDNFRSLRPDGEVYPRIQLRAQPLKNKTGFVIIDETGWDGFKETEDFVVSGEGIFPSEDEAMIRIDALVSEEDIDSLVRCKCGWQGSPETDALVNLDNRDELDCPKCFSRID